MKKILEKPRTSHRPKEAIHAAATALFAEQGYAATSIREICQRAGITKPVLYYYFGNKEQLFQELILDAFNEYRKELMWAARQGRTASEKLLHVVEAIFAFVRENPTRARLAFRLLFAPEKSAPPMNFQEMHGFDRRLIAEIVRGGVQKGELTGRPAEVAEALCGVITLHVMDFLIFGDPTLSRSRAQRAMDLLLHGCKTHPTKR